MRIVIDVEADALVDPTHIWVVVCKDIDTNQYHIFREKENLDILSEFLSKCTYIIGHNILGYDIPTLYSVLGITIELSRVLDTLIISKLVDYPRIGHSIESYGIEFGIEKGKFFDFSKYSKLMEDYCIRDVDICHRIYNKYRRYIDKPEHRDSIALEHEFQLVVNQLHTNGFAFNVKKAEGLLEKVTKELGVLDAQILEAFPPRLKLIREITPRETKYGTLNRNDFRWLKDGDLSVYNGGSFSLCTWSSFNPSSHKQIIEVLSNAGWSPVNKTKTHIETERELTRLKYSKSRDTELDIRLKELDNKLQELRKTGWKVDEENLDTLPATAPPPSRLLAKRILLESRRRTLTEWISLCTAGGRIHGKFYALGAWTHRMAHQNPNTANIPNEFDTAGKKKLYGKELRSLWMAPKNRLLVGVDAEGIQLRIFAHYINDPEFTEALVTGKKEDKSDPHSLNQRILGNVCKTRQAAKRYIYALLLGAGSGKLAEILGCTSHEADEAFKRLIGRYEGFARLKETRIPTDARRGYFTGLDNRLVRIPGDTVGSRKHLCMSGYLQNGEAVVMKRATVKWHDKLRNLDAKLVNFVHDEWQTECPNNMEIALKIARMQADSLEEVGRELNLLCPLAGSYWNDDNKDYTIATNWSYTH